jgi:hypothetical protein
MSRVALGQKQTCAVQKPISALPRKQIAAYALKGLDEEAHTALAHRNTINGGQWDSPFWNLLAAPWLALPFRGRSAVPRNLVRHQL